MVMMFVGGGVCRCSTEFLYYSYYTKPTVREFFVPAQTQIGVFLVKRHIDKIKQSQCWNFDYQFLHRPCKSVMVGEYFCSRRKSPRCSLDGVIIQPMR